MERKKPIYIFAGAAPIALLATIATATLLLGDASSTALVALFPLLYFFYSALRARQTTGTSWPSRCALSPKAKVIYPLSHF